MFFCLFACSFLDAFVRVSQSVVPVSVSLSIVSVSQSVQFFIYSCLLTSIFHYGLLSLYSVFRSDPCVSLGCRQIIYSSAYSNCRTFSRTFPTDVMNPTFGSSELEFKSFMLFISDSTVTVVSTSVMLDPVVKCILCHFF